MTLNSTRGIEMLGYLPSYYITSRVMESILQSEGLEFDNLKDTLNQILDNNFVETATWALDIWEQELGIVPTASMTDGQRREAIKAKIRGVGTLNVQLLQSVAQSYDRGTIQVTEQPSMYQFTVHFMDTIGIPPNLNDLKKRIEEIKPAHLQVVYQYNYTLLSQVNQVMTINQIQTHKLTDFSPFIQ